MAKKDDDKENIQLIREQLRAQKAQLKKLDVEKVRQETRFKHMLTVTGKKITKLQQTVEDQQEQIKFQRGLGPSRAIKSPTAKEPAPKKEETKDDADVPRYEELTRTLKALQRKNLHLTDRKSVV